MMGFFLVCMPKRVYLSGDEWETPAVLALTRFDIAGNWSSSHSIISIFTFYSL